MNGSTQPNRLEAPARHEFAASIAQVTRALTIDVFRFLRNPTSGAGNLGRERRQTAPSAMGSAAPGSLLSRRATGNFLGGDRIRWE
jgi:hypothetical protein